MSSSVDVQVAAMNSPAIATSINGKSPGGNTPTRAGIERGRTYLQGLGTPNPKYLLLATDGQPNCSTSCDCPPLTTKQGNQCCTIIGNLCTPCITGGADDAAAIMAVGQAAGAGIPTFVIGISTGSDAEMTLNEMAKAGLRPRAATPQYYPVANQADLVTAMQQIAGQIVSCTFPLATPPMRPDLVDITIDGNKVPRDPTHMNGWDFNPGNGSIQFYGAACTGLQMMGSMVQAVYGCPPIN